MTKRTKCIICVLAIFPILFLINSKQNSQQDYAEGYPWDSSEQYLVSCSVDGETVQFRYAMTYKNTSKYDVCISHIVCSFEPDELADWFGSQSDGIFPNIQSGFVDSAEREIIIPSGETRVIVFVFEGAYLGGELPSTLCKPNNVIWGEKVIPFSQAS